MKLRNKILAMAIVAVAGVNVYIANGNQTQNNNFSLLTLENIAEAEECTAWTEPINGGMVRKVTCDGACPELCKGYGPLVINPDGSTSCCTGKFSAVES